MKSKVMSKNVRREAKPRAMPSIRKRRVLMATGLLLSLLAASALMAQRGRLWPAAARRNVAAQNEPTSLTSPSKEYIYAGSRLVATEEPLPCSFSAAPNSAFFLSEGGTGSVSVTAASGCSWTASPNVNWMTITSGSTGTGNGTVNYSVGQSGLDYPRQGTLTIAGQNFTQTFTFTVVQGVDTCPIVYSPTLPPTLPVNGGSGTLTITVESPRCAWAAISNASWLTISACCGSGNGTVTYSAAPNTTGVGRSTPITFGGSGSPPQTVTIKQK